MRNDQIFVLMLVILLPMSGCFDGAIGDAEGADDESSTTVVNNYYNNTTVVEPNAPLLHQFANGTILISTNPGEIVEVVSVDAVRGYYSSWSGPSYSEAWTGSWDAHLVINCTMIKDNATIDLIDTGLNVAGFAKSDMLPSDGGSCNYTIVNQWDYGESYSGTGLMSITYRIHNTV